jgi:hypothetical protein
MFGVPSGEFLFRIPSDPDPATSAFARRRGKDARSDRLLILSDWTIRRSIRWADVQG